MNHLRPIMPALALYVGVFLACIAMAASPACSKNERTKTLHASLIAVNAARDGFVAWDRQHQTDLVAKATSREELDATVSSYILKRTVIVASFETTYRALALAATTTDDLSLRAALDAAVTLIDSITKLRGGP